MHPKYSCTKGSAPLKNTIPNATLPAGKPGVFFCRLLLTSFPSANTHTQKKYEKRTALHTLRRPIATRRAREADRHGKCHRHDAPADASLEEARVAGAKTSYLRAAGAVAGRKEVRTNVCLQNKHGVAVAAEAVAFFHSRVVGFHDKLVAAEGSHHH